MKISNSCFWLFLGIFILGSFNSCSKKGQKIVQEEEDYTNSIQVVYQELDVCCTNLFALEPFVYPAMCQSPDGMLFANNLADFNIDQNYSTGDTLRVKFKLTNECEASACDIACDRRHGLPVELVEVVD